MAARPGLRERKKARTRETIQRTALDLIRRQGYAATTIAQICDAAEISESTFFRYFRTKEDLVLADAYDEAIIEAFRAQPPELGTLQALRRAIRSVFETFPREELTGVRERALLGVAVPEVRGAALLNMVETGRLLADLVAARVGREPTDPEVQSFAGAVIGVMMAQVGIWSERPEIDVLDSMDAALDFLERGLPIDAGAKRPQRRTSARRTGRASARPAR